MQICDPLLSYSRRNEFIGYASENEWRQPSFCCTRWCTVTPWWYIWAAAKLMSGVGKTTLISSWRYHHPHPVVGKNGDSVTLIILLKSHSRSVTETGWEMGNWVLSPIPWLFYAIRLWTFWCSEHETSSSDPTQQHTAVQLVIARLPALGLTRIIAASHYDKISDGNKGRDWFLCLLVSGTLVCALTSLWTKKTWQLECVKEGTAQLIGNRKQSEEGAGDQVPLSKSYPLMTYFL